ncbi:MAG: hypothetical protein A2381_19240 [Bdellovibrionales bacterium RIFOXYB1_FULL_37_110]|nr:MAG: hypothetical protein A2417_04390 [Bdellovibrionales bacterium RIFOXYC1_FULL_37_79]OFZ58667.1 MAG: hypothetical protein A2381_19240 [Bdellovibrionales bacterium RIFOXYB1_FULL_37_110]
MLAFIPERAWESFFVFSKQSFSNVLKYGGQFKHLSNVYSGELLLFKVTMLASELNVGKVGSPIELHSYKFYTGLLEELLTYKRQFGISLSKILIPIRGGIKKDFQFEKKIQNELVGGIFQFLFVSIITWLFSFMVYKMVQLDSSWLTKMIILVLQILGTTFYVIIYRMQKIRQFKIFETYFQVLFFLMSLIDVGLSSSKVLHQSGFSRIDELKDPHFLIVNKKLKGLVEVYKNNGHQIKSDLEGLIEEIYFLQEERFEQFLKFLGILKFVILCLFFLSAYFIYLFTLFSLFLME